MCKKYCTVCHWADLYNYDIFAGMKFVLHVYPLSTKNQVNPLEICVYIYNYNGQQLKTWGKKIATKIFSTKNSTSTINIPIPYQEVCMGRDGNSVVVQPIQVITLWVTSGFSLERLYTVAWFLHIINRITFIKCGETNF